MEKTWIIMLTVIFLIALVGCNGQTSRHFFRQADVLFDWIVCHKSPFLFECSILSTPSRYISNDFLCVLSIDTPSLYGMVLVLKQGRLL